MDSFGRKLTHVADQSPRLWTATKLALISIRQDGVY